MMRKKLAIKSNVVAQANFVLCLFASSFVLPYPKQLLQACRCELLAEKVRPDPRHSAQRRRPRPQHCGQRTWQCPKQWKQACSQDKDISKRERERERERWMLLRFSFLWICIQTLTRAVWGTSMFKTLFCKAKAEAMRHRLAGGKIGSPGNWPGARPPHPRRRAAPRSRAHQPTRLSIWLFGAERNKEEE